MHPRSRDHRRQQLLDRRARHGSKRYGASDRDPEYRNDRFGQVTRPARERVALGTDLGTEAPERTPVVRTMASTELFWSSDHGDPAAVLATWTERQELIERAGERRLAPDRARWGGPRMRSGSIARVA